MSGGNLAVFVSATHRCTCREEPRARARKTLLRAKPRRMFAGAGAAAAGFDANHLHVGIPQKIIEKPDGVRTAANACEQMRGQAFFGRQNLFARFTPITD